MIADELMMLKRYGTTLDFGDIDRKGKYIVFDVYLRNSQKDTGLPQGLESVLLFISERGAVQTHLGIRSNGGYQSLVTGKGILPDDVCKFMGKKLKELGVDYNKFHR